MALFLVSAAMVLMQAVDVDGVQPVPDLAEPVIEAVEAPMPTPHAYLYAAHPTLARKLDCMIMGESTWNPYASGAGGRYIGLAQFDRGTWLETPQGKLGYARTNPYAAIDALAWGVTHLGYGRWPVTSRRC